LSDLSGRSIEGKKHYNPPRDIIGERRLYGHLNRDHRGDTDTIDATSRLSARFRSRLADSFRISRVSGKRLIEQRLLHTLYRREMS
jgi:hypothetical protein